MSLQLRFAQHSEIGPVRKNNQDSGYASPRLLVVADGMGGAAAGDLASAVAIDTIKALDTPSAGSGPSTGSGSDGTGSGNELEELATALRRANNRIADLIADDFHLEGMGTTVTGALFDGKQLSLVHIGDSRAYLLRDGRLEQLTHDHSWVQSLVDDGKITEAEAAVHPHRSLLLRVLNGQPANEPDLTKLVVQPGDRVLFCSDGICGLVDDPDILAALLVPELERALEQLVGEALAAGGIDNITAILADVVDADPSTTTGQAAAAVVLGAAAERKIPEVREGLARSAEADKDTVIRGLTTGAASTGTATLTPSPPAEPEDEARYNPQPPRRGRFVRILAAAAVLVLVLGAGLGAGWAWTRNQYFVGAAADRVAIYQGLPENLPGIQLSSVYEIQPLQLSVLPQYYRDMIAAGIEVESLDAARQTVAQLTDTAKRCANPTPTPKPPVTPSRPATPVSPPPSGPATSGPPRTPAPPNGSQSPQVGPTVNTTPPIGPPASTSSVRPPTPAPTGSPASPSGSPASPSASPRPDC